MKNVPTGTFFAGGSVPPRCQVPVLEACASSLAASVFLPTNSLDFPGDLGEAGSLSPEFALVERVLDAAIGELEGFGVVPGALSLIHI